MGRQTLTRPTLRTDRSLQTGSFAGGSGGGAGKVEVTDLTVYKFIDKASPQLFLASALGNHIRSATLVVRKSGFTLYKIVLDGVIISSVNDNGSTIDQNGNLVETITLNWSRMSWTFIPQNPDGSRGSPITRRFDLISLQGG